MEFDWKNKIFDDSIFTDSIFNQIGHESSVMFHDGSGGGGVPEYSRSNSMESSSSSVSDTSSELFISPPDLTNERYGTTGIIIF